MLNAKRDSGDLYGQSELTAGAKVVYRYPRRKIPPEKAARTAGGGEIMTSSTTNPERKRKKDIRRSMGSDPMIRGVIQSLFKPL